MRSDSISGQTVIAALVLSAAFATPVLAQEEDIPLVPIPIPFDMLDLNGTWNYTTSQPTVSGACPAGSAVAGTAAIGQQGTGVTFQYTSGARCQPAGVCSYTGTIDEEDNQFVVANSVVVDDEGGTVSSAIRLTVFNNGLAKGEGTNHYVHPEGFECRWNMDVTLTREVEGIRE